MTTTTTEETITIVLSERRPIRIIASDWPIIANAGRNIPQLLVVVREHKDGRRIVYGWRRGDKWVGSEGGFLIEARKGLPDEDETIRAIRRVGGLIVNTALASECIANLPPVDLE